MISHPGRVEYANCFHWKLAQLFIPIRKSCRLVCSALFLFVAIFAPPASAGELKEGTTQLTPLPEPLASFGAAKLNGYLYVYGGHVGERHDHSHEHVRGTFRRQPLTGGKWEELPGGPAVQSPALVAQGGRLYRIGGLSARNSSEETPDLHSLASVDCFDPTTRTWSPVAVLLEPRSSHDAVVVDNHIYVVGGWNHHGDEGEGDWLDSLLVLDLSRATPNWEVVSKTPFQRRALALAALDDKLYVIGGMTEEIDFSQRVDVFDINSREWSRGPDLPESDYNGFGASAFNVGGRLFL